MAGRSVSDCYSLFSMNNAAFNLAFLSREGGGGRRRIGRLPRELSGKLGPAGSLPLLSTLPNFCQNNEHGFTNSLLPPRLQPSPLSLSHFFSGSLFFRLIVSRKKTLVSRFDIFPAPRRVSSKKVVILWWHIKRLCYVRHKGQGDLD